MAPKPHCPVCGNTKVPVWAKATDLEYYTTDKLYDYRHCPDCECLFINPIPLKLLSTIYPKNYYSFEKGKPSLAERIKRALDKQFFKKWMGRLKGQALSALDIGGGNGWMLNILKDTDPRLSRTQVVDISSNAKKEALAQGHRYFEGRIEDFKPKDKFDFVLMLNLIEHVNDPVGVLQKIEKTMNPGGVLVLKTPNIDSWDARLFRHLNWAGYHCPRHWTLFSEKSMRAMVSQTGLKVESFSYTQGAPFWAQSTIIYLMMKHILKRDNSKPVIYHPLCAPLLLFFAALDFLRKPLFKTSQMFVILSKRP